MVKLNPEVVERMRARHREWVECRAAVFRSHVEIIANELPDWRAHPYFTTILWEWYDSIDEDVPSDWFRVAAEDCRRFFANLPWPPREDGEAISVAACRKALDGRGDHMRDEEVRFLRDQLYVLAEMLVDGTRRREQ